MIIFTVLVTGVVLTLSVLSILSVRKGSNKARRGSLIDSLIQGSRHRDGAVTYNQFEGRRFNVEVEDPHGLPGARYRRRHSPKQHKRMKPWQK